MKRLLTSLIYLYPRVWRERYSQEFAALLEDTGAGWRQIPDILTEALQMRIATLNLRLIGLFALFGLAIATIASFRIPDKFVSVAVVKLLPVADGDDATARREMVELTRGVTSQSSLVRLFNDLSVDLYKDERRRYPLGMIIEDMKSHDLSVNTRPDGLTLVTYRGTSPAEAQTVVRLMVDRLREDHGHRHSFPPGLRNAPHLPASRLDVVNAPSFDNAPIYPNRPVIALVGIFLGIGAAFAFVLIRKAPGFWFRGALTLIGLALLSRFLPFPSESRSVVVFDSPATARSVRVEVEKSLQPGVTLTPDPRATGLKILARHSDRILAQRLGVDTIRQLEDAVRARQAYSQTTWAEVLDGPSFPVLSIADIWQGRTIYTALALVLVSGSLLLVDRRRRREVQPA